MKKENVSVSSKRLSRENKLFNWSWIHTTVLRKSNLLNCYFLCSNKKRGGGDVVLLKILL